MFHDTADEHFTGVVSYGVGINFYGAGEETVDEHWAFSGESSLFAKAAGAGQFSHRPLKMIVIVNDLHGTTTEHVTRAHKHRETHVIANDPSLFEGDSSSSGRLRYLQFVTKTVPKLTVFGSVD